MITTFRSTLWSSANIPDNTKDVLKIQSANGTKKGLETSKEIHSVSKKKNFIHVNSSR